MLRLAGGFGQPARLELDGHHDVPPPLADAVRAELRLAGEPRSRAALRHSLRVNNARLGDALQALEQRRLVVRGPSGWSLPPQPDPRQLSPLGS